MTPDELVELSEIVTRRGLRERQEQVQLMAIAIGSIFDHKIIKRFNELTSSALASKPVRRDRVADAQHSVNELGKLVAAGMVGRG